MSHSPPSSVARPRLEPARGRFLLVAAGLYGLWLLVYEGLVGPNGRLDTCLSEQVARAGASLLRALSFAASTRAGSSLLYMDGRPAVVVGAACDGLALYALFAGFVLAYPGPGRVRLWFVPLGVASLFILNVVRVAALALNHHYAHRSVEFNHHYTFNFVVYGCICGLWVWWVRRYGRVADDAA